MYMAMEILLDRKCQGCMFLNPNIAFKASLELLGIFVNRENKTPPVFVHSA